MVTAVRDRWLLTRTAVRAGRVGSCSAATRWTLPSGFECANHNGAVALGVRRLLTMIVSLEAIFLSTFAMISHGRRN
jgi:hypothetical protein